MEKIWENFLAKSIWTFSPVQVLSRVQFCDPKIAECQASLSITNSQSLFKFLSIKLVMPSNHLILCFPLLLLPSVFPSIRVFSNMSIRSCLRWKEWPSGLVVKNLPGMLETQIWSLGQEDPIEEDPIEEGMAPHSRILAWRIPWTEKCGGLWCLFFWLWCIFVVECQLPLIMETGSRAHGFNSCSAGFVAPRDVGSQFPNQIPNPCPLHWKACS